VAQDRPADIGPHPDLAPVKTRPAQVRTAVIRLGQIGSLRRLAPGWQTPAASCLRSASVRSAPPRGWLLGEVGAHLAHSLDSDVNAEARPGQVGT
jgi:hypothetical protein